MSLVQITELGQTAAGGIRVRVWLPIGEVKMQVNRSTGAAGDFIGKTPTTTTSSRGTQFSIYYDGTATTVAVTQHSVLVTANNGASVVVQAGMATRSTAVAVATPAPIEKAFKSGGLSSAQALARMSNALASGLKRCNLGVVSSRLAPVSGGWSAALVIVGAQQGIAAKPKGTASFRLAGSRVKPGNKLAKRIAAGCR